MRPDARIVWLLARSALRRLWHVLRARAPMRVLGLAPSHCAVFAGRALVSYLPAPPDAAANELGRGHSNTWESAQITTIFREAGYVVDAIDWKDRAFTSSTPYDVVFDIHENLPRFAKNHVTAILHVTGSHPTFSNAAEEERLRWLRERRGATLRPRRQVAPESVSRFDEGLAVADLVTLIGNDLTLATFPRSVHERIRLVTVTGSYLRARRVPESLPSRPRRPGFLWFGGSGAVHKGLDLVLEVFARHPSLTLHCVGPYEGELDFAREYRRELYALPNVVSHGYLLPSHPRFEAVANQCLAFVLPSCSEAISTAAVTCLDYGLLPIVSNRCGLDLPPDTGTVLDRCTPDEITDALELAIGLSWDDAVAAIRRVQALVDQRYSRASFARRMREVLGGLLADAGRTSRADRHPLP